VGSVNYIAPEYLLDGHGSHASDIFSLGVIVYELLTGALPFKISETRQHQRKGLQDYHYISARERRPDLPLWVDLALEKATHPHARQRYQALSEFVQDLCVPNQDMLTRHRSAPLLERNPLRFWRSLALILLVVVIVQWALLAGS
jgi:serine/threonine protein kinase